MKPQNKAAWQVRSLILNSPLWVLRKWLSGKESPYQCRRCRRQEDLDGHEFEQAPGVGDEQGSLECGSQWDGRVGHS